LVKARDATGRAALLQIASPFLLNASAPFRLLNTGNPVAHALVTVTTLEEQFYARGASNVVGQTGLDGGFELPQGVPSDSACVVNVKLAAGHRLSALLPIGQQQVEVDESTSMVTEMARWQVRTDGGDAGAQFNDLKPAQLVELHSNTRDLLKLVTLEVIDGAAPSIPSLKVGAGHQLRNAYVEAFGSRVTHQGDSSPPAANRLADAWEQWLGFRPLGLSRAVGTGIRGYSQSDGVPAPAAQLVSPRDAVSDAFGNTYLSQYDTQLLSLVPARAVTGPVYGANKSGLGAGGLHTIAGVQNGPIYPDQWQEQFEARAAASTPDGVPMFNADAAQPQGFPLFSPHKIVLEPVAAVSLSHVYFTQPFTGRVMLMPVSEVRHFARHDESQGAYQARHLYCVAGRGMDLTGDGAWTPAKDGEVGTAAGLHFPTGLARDNAGNLWILDAGNGEPGSGGLLVLREADGLIFRIPLSRAGQAFTPDGAQDLRLSPDEKFLYVADTERHWVFRLPTPAVGPQSAASNIERVAGRPPERQEDLVFSGAPGFLDTQQKAYPAIYEASAGVPDFAGEAPAPQAVTALLSKPGSICFDAVGDLLIADTGNGRIRLKRGDRLFTIAGGLDTRFLTGDARLGYFPATTYLNLEADGNVLLTDRAEAVVRRLHTRRGTLVRRR
jgi:sugar lactone lactonase YvrE